VDLKQNYVHCLKKNQFLTEYPVFFACNLESSELLKIFNKKILNIQYKFLKMKHTLYIPIENTEFFLSFTEKIK
jgi:hypothetical protein